MTTASEYESAIRQVVYHIRRWRALNPQRAVQIQFNYPRNVLLAATITDAMKGHFVSANDGGMMLINEILGVFQVQKLPEPSVLMLRFGMDIEQQERAQ